jgi:hypothetical protein
LYNIVNIFIFAGPVLKQNIAMSRRRFSDIQGRPGGPVLRVKFQRCIQSVLASSGGVSVHHTKDFTKGETWRSGAFAGAGPLL